MLRPIALYVFFLSFLTLCSFGVLAQDQSETPKPLTATPELLSLIQSSEAALADVDKPETKAMMLFEILTFELRLTDKQYARNTIQKILALLPSIERKGTQQQIYTTLTYALLEMGDREAAIRMTQRIEQTAVRAETQLNIAERMIEADQKATSNPSTQAKADITGLLGNIVTAAREVKDPGLEAIALAQLGSQFAKQGKTNEAKKSFADSRQKAKELEEIEERDIIALILRNQVFNGLQDDAIALLESVKDSDQKNMFTGVIAQTLASTGKIDAAKKAVESLQSADVKDNVLIGLAREVAKNAPVAQLAALMDSISQEERKTIFLNAIAPLLAENDRLDVFSQLAQKTADAEDFERTVKFMRLEKLLEQKDFDAADKLTAEFKDEQIAQAAHKHVILGRLKAGEMEKAFEQAAKAQTEEDKATITDLNNQAEAIAKMDNAEEKLNASYDLLQAQLGLFDLKGVKKTLDMMLQNAGQFDDPAKVVANRLVLARMQSDLNDSDGAKQNLRQLLEFLANNKHVMSYKGLAEEDADTPITGDNMDDNQPLINMKKPIDEDTVLKKLAEVYFSIADAQARDDDISAARKTLETVRPRIEALTDPQSKFGMLLFLAQMLGEFDLVEKEGKK